MANVKLAALDPKLRNRIRQSAEALNLIEQQVSYQYLVYELERIYSYLATELENPAAKGYLPLQDRLNVAEYGLLEGQVESCSNELNQKGVLDADIVAVIAEQMTDFKRRLGIDYFVTGLTFDREAIQSWLNELVQITKSGLMFYVKGCKLFWNERNNAGHAWSRQRGRCACAAMSQRFFRRWLCQVFVRNGLLMMTARISDFILYSLAAVASTI